MRINKTIQLKTQRSFKVLPYLRSSFFLFSFFLPLNTGISNAFLITSIVVAIVLLYQNPPPKTIWIKKKMLIYSVLPFFLLHVLGLLYTDYLEDGYRYLEKTISFLLLPVIFLFFRKELLTILSKVVLKGLLYGCIVSLLVLLTLNFYNYFLSNDILIIKKSLFDYYHTYHYFTKPLEQHPTYLGVYYLTSLIFINRTIRKTSVKVVLFALFCTGLIFLNSRIIFFGFVFCAAFFLLRGAYRLVTKKKFKLLLIFGIGLGLGVFALSKQISDTYIGYRIKNIYRFEVSLKSEEKINSKTKANPRMSRWISSLELVREKPLFGYGTADEYPNLKKKFEKNGLFAAAKNEYNTHNQFIGYAIRFGIFGFLCLICFFILNLRLAIINNNIQYALLVFIVFFVCLVENFFDRNFGITFSAVFFTLFTYIGLLNPKFKFEKR